MSKNSLYLKYRPTQLDDIVGHQFHVETLRQASMKNKFAHAYLFAGVHGSGKTTTARILANLLTCENPSNGTTCGKCLACKTVPFGMAQDVIELDGASNGDVAHVQLLIEGAQWSPVHLNRKVYIIDECQQLSGKAISSLLKIVEEPPEHLVFIFCTTDPDKIPATILSRSQRFKFKHINLKDIANRLRYIADKEAIKVEDNALYAMAKIGRGCMRDSIVPLEQIATIQNNETITEAHVSKYFGIPDRQAIIGMVNAMLTSNVSLLMDQVNDMIVSSAEIKDIAFEISEIFRNIMVIKAQGGKHEIIELPDNEISQLKGFLEVVNIGQIIKLSRIFSTLKKEIEYSVNDRWVLESALIQGVAILRK